MSNDLDTALGVVAIEPRKHTVVGYAVLVELGLLAVRRPGFDYRVVVFVIRNGNVGVYVVADCLDLDVQFCEFCVCLFLFCGLLFLQFGHLLEQIVGILLGLLLLPNLLLKSIDSATDLCCCVLCCWTPSQQCVRQ